MGSKPRERALADITQRPFAAALVNCQHLDGQTGKIWCPSCTGPLSQLPKTHHLSASSCAPTSVCRASWREELALLKQTCLSLCAALTVWLTPGCFRPRSAISLLLYLSHHKPIIAQNHGSPSCLALIKSQ